MINSLEKIFSDKIISIKPLSGGDFNKLWLVETISSKFAVKEINPHATKNKWFPNNYEISEKISNFFKEQGLPAVSAMMINDHYVNQSNDSWFIVYPFIAGTTLELKEINFKKSQEIGKIFSEIHNLNKKSFEGIQPHYDLFDNDHWGYLIKENDSEFLKKMQSFIFYCNDKYHASIDNLNKELIVSHRDMHHKNILWDAFGKPHILDWESAGLINPQMEIVGYGLEWSGIIYSQFDKQIFENLMSSYLSNLIIKNNTDNKTAFYGWFGHCVLGWTEFNLRRRIGLTSNEESEINNGKWIIENVMIKCLTFIRENELDILKLINFI